MLQYLLNTWNYFRDFGFHYVLYDFSCYNFTVDGILLYHSIITIPPIQWTLFVQLNNITKVLNVTFRDIGLALIVDRSRSSQADKVILNFKITTIKR